MVTLYDHNFTKEDMEKVQKGDVIVYSGSCLDSYLIVSGVNIDECTVYGQLATTRGLNCVTLDKLIE